MVEYYIQDIVDGNFCKAEYGDVMPEIFQNIPPTAWFPYAMMLEERRSKTNIKTYQGNNNTIATGLSVPSTHMPSRVLEVLHATPTACDAEKAFIDNWRHKTLTAMMLEKSMEKRSKQ